MLLWIVIGAAVVALAAFAFWPRRKGIVDGDVRRSRRRDQGHAEPYDNPGFGGF